jgi:hypothetical protein
MSDVNDIKEFWNVFSIKSTYYILSGISFAAALGWGNTVKAFLDENFPKPNSKTTMNLIYSIVITLMLVILIYLMPDTERELPHKIRKKIKNQKEIREENREKQVQPIYLLNVR